MDGQKGQKDYWDKADIFLKHIVAALIPLALFLLGAAVRDTDRSEARARAVTDLLAKAADAKNEEQLELTVASLASYGNEAISPLRAMIYSEYRLRMSPLPSETVDAATFEHYQMNKDRRIRLLAMQLSYLGSSGAATFVDLIESLDINMSHNANPFINTIDDPLVSEFSEMIVKEPDATIPALLKATRERSTKGTYAIVLGLAPSSRWDSQVYRTLLDNAYDPHGGEGNQPWWYPDCVIAVGKIVENRIDKPEWVRERLVAMRKQAGAPKSAIDFALAQFAAT